jgi:transcriptional regulator with XRE-family HTH domain
MDRSPKFTDADLSALKEIKKAAGDRVRQERKLLKVTQPELAANMGVSLRWFREIETGASMTHIDDHLNAAIRLGLSTGHIALPILYMGQGRRFPPQLIHADLAAMERGCMDVVADVVINLLKRDRPSE